ncbi:hypothetical protein [Paraburkholderia sp. MM5384-R2]|uniref:hypothetical protein n=1 Tax=Paraburkholderia sp. MM5384-R2 TaxID=2723097 RepID=UPI001616AE88|nr:hypothetical protein [Paraburkholderia sp. MM5384-R2]MBB5503580.1 hypothetical protein [Paraburkholderia sp. MM5384-R2]
MGAFEGAVDFACNDSDIQSKLFHWLKGIAAAEEDRKKIQLTGMRFVLMPAVQISAAYNIRFWVDIGTVDQGRFIADKNNHSIALSHYQRLSDQDKRRTSEPRAPLEEHYVDYDQRTNLHQGDHVTALELVWTQAASSLGEKNLSWIQTLIKKRPDAPTTSPQAIEAKMAEAGVTVSTFVHPPLNPIIASVAKRIEEKLGKEIEKQHLSGVSYWKRLSWQDVGEDNCRFTVERKLLLPFVLVEYTRKGKTYSCVLDGAFPGRVVGQKPWRTPSELYASFKRLFSRKKADGATMEAGGSSPESMGEEFQEVPSGGADTGGKRRVGPWRSLLAPFLSFVGIFVLGIIEMAMSLSSNLVGATVFFGTSAVIIWTPIRFARAFKHRRRTVAAAQIA